MPYKSRKRKTEEAVKAVFEIFAGTSLGTTQVLTGRDVSNQDATHIHIHCNMSEPTTDETEQLLNFRVSGSITVQSAADANTRDQISVLEGLVESFVEQDTETIVADLNGSSGVADFGVWEFQPGQCEDGLDEENRRYISSYTFEAVVGQSTY